MLNWIIWNRIDLHKMDLALNNLLYAMKPQPTKLLEIVILIMKDKSP